MNTLYLKEFKDTQKLSLTKKQVEKTLIAQVFCGMKPAKMEAVNQHSTDVKTIALTYCGMCCGCGNCRNGHMSKHVQTSMGEVTINTLTDLQNRGVHSHRRRDTIELREQGKRIKRTSSGRVIVYPPPIPRLNRSLVSRFWTRMLPSPSNRSPTHRYVLIRLHSWNIRR